MTLGFELSPEIGLSQTCVSVDCASDFDFAFAVLGALTFIASEGLRLTLLRGGGGWSKSKSSESSSSESAEG
jgi:hypothetical protein